MDNGLSLRTRKGSGTAKQTSYSHSTSKDLLRLSKRSTRSSQGLIPSLQGSTSRSSRRRLVAKLAELSLLKTSTLAFVGDAFTPILSRQLTLPSTRGIPP